MTVVINHHLVLTKREWTAVINALDYMDAQLYAESEMPDFLKDALKESFPSDFIRETSEKIATSK